MCIFDGRKGTLAAVVLMKIFIYGGTQLMAEANGKKIADIYWNTSNPIFYFDNDKHIFAVRIQDYVNVICPTYRPGYPEIRTEYSLIYSVDERSYATCTIDRKKAKIFGICSKPDTDQIVTVVFRDFSPLPGGLEFRPNNTYYVISTSDGSKSGLNNERGGLCSNYNMRLKFHVKPRCRTNSAANGDDSRQQEDEDCQNRATDQRDRRPPPLWEVNAEPPPFPRQPFIWPNSGLSPRDHSRPAGMPRSDSSSIYCTHKVLWWLLWLVFAGLFAGLLDA